MATPQFHPLRIREVRPETADAVTVPFDVPARAARRVTASRRGQFVTLKDAYRRRGNAPLPYSICVGVTDYDRDGELRIGIKRVRGGRVLEFRLRHAPAGPRDRRDDTRRPLLRHAPERRSRPDTYVALFGRLGHHAGARDHQDDARSGADAAPSRWSTATAASTRSCSPRNWKI